MTTKTTLTGRVHPVALRPAVPPLFFAEAIGALGNNLLDLGIFYYTAHYLSWPAWMNLALAAAKGTAYVIGALQADRVSKRWHPRRALICNYLLLMVLALTISLVTWQPLWIALMVVLSFFTAINWPMLESGVCANLDAHQLSRRVGVYNLVWSGVGALAVAASGTIIEFNRMGIFLIPAAGYLLAAVMLWLWPQVPDVPAAGHAPLAAEAQLLHKRTLALWLSRIALPSTFVVLSSLSAIMPALPVMKTLETSMQTLLGSVWMVARWLTFLALGATVWWHTRPRVLLWCAVGMLVAFLGVTARMSDFFGIQSPAMDMIAMAAWQVALGFCMGMIYTASLYFGMVLSSGSTEHGGYHEALIGLGSAIGPGAAAIVQLQFQGNLNASVGVVATLLTISVAASVVANKIAAKR